LLPAASHAGAGSASPLELRARLVALRETIFEVAAATPGVGTLTNGCPWVS